MSVYPAGLGPGFSVGTPITITVPITSRCSIDVDIRLEVEVWEGRYLIGTVAMITSYSLDSVIAPDATVNFNFPHTVATGPNWGAGQYRRDLKATLSYWNGSQWVVYGEYGWEDIYHVTAFAFDIGTPVVAAV